MQLIRFHRAPDPEDQNDDGKPQRDLGDGDGNGEQRENQARRIRGVAGEGHQVHVDRVQHQLDAQEDPDGVPPRQDAEEADREQAGRQDQIGLEPHHSSFRAKKSAPRSPARKSTARSSNGSTKRVRRSRPMAWVRSPVRGGAAAGSFAPAMKTTIQTRTARETRPPVKTPRLVWASRSPPTRSVPTLGQTPALAPDSGPA